MTSDSHLQLFSILYTWCLFSFLNRFAWATTENLIVVDRCYLWINNLVKSPCCHMHQAWNSSEISAFLFLSLLLISMIFSLSDYFPEKVVFDFSKNLAQFVLKIRHAPIRRFDIKVHWKFDFEKSELKNISHKWNKSIFRKISETGWKNLLNIGN